MNRFQKILMILPWLVLLGIMALLNIIVQKNFQDNMTGLQNLLRFMFLFIWFTMFMLWVTQGNILTPEEDNIVNKEMSAEMSACGTLPSETALKLAIKLHTKQIQNAFLKLLWSICLLLPLVSYKYFHIGRSNFSENKAIFILWVLYGLYMVIANLRALYVTYRMLRCCKLLLAKVVEDV